MLNNNNNNNNNFHRLNYLTTPRMPVTNDSIKDNKMWNISKPL